MEVAGVRAADEAEAEAGEGDRQMELVSAVETLETLSLAAESPG